MRWLVAVVLSMSLTLSACSGVVTLELPSLAHLEETSRRTPPVQSVIYDVHGEELTVLRDQYREPVSLVQLPTHLVKAVLTAEDRRFFQHTGVDARSLTRAALSNLASGEVGQGGSTITQQLIKILYMPDAPRTTETKLQEAVLARELESERSKASILEEYLNTVYFGEGAYGIEAAAQTYFRKPARDLDVAESALLAAIIRAPEALTPTRSPDAALSRRDDVLWRMAEDGHLTPEERDTATATPIVVHSRSTLPSVRDPHLVDMVIRELLGDPRFGATEEERARRLYGGGLHIHTTVRPDLQALARESLARHLPDEGDPDAAISLVDPHTGHVLAAVGSRPYEELQFDLATQGRRQPGSTFKTFVLAAAISDGWHPEDRIDGRQGDVVLAGGGVWQGVRNYDRRSYPGISLTEATRASVNTAFARLGVEVGIERVAGLAGAMGVRSPVPSDVQITIGGGALGVTTLDLAASMGTLANLGNHVPTTVVSRIEDGNGRAVWVPDRPRQVLSPSAAFVTLDVLRNVVERGTGTNARVEGWEVAGKTGTTSDHTDAWFMGTTTALSGAVWVGHADGRVPMGRVQGVARVTGGSIPALIFSDVMTAALEGIDPEPFTLPDREYALVEIDPRTGLRAASWCPGRTERIPRVLVPEETCPEPPPPPPAPEEPEEPEEPDELEEPGELEEEVPEEAPSEEEDDVVEDPAGTEEEPEDPAEGDGNGAGDTGDDGGDDAVPPDEGSDDGG
jgi:membrane peptidoglycan carboxypeptidase